MSKKFFFLFIISAVLLSSCKSAPSRLTQARTNAITKNLIEDSKNIGDIFVAGYVMITGNKDIPAAYIKFESKGNIKDKKANFKLSVLTKPLLEISLDGDRVLFINHTASQFMEFRMEEINFSQIVGFNFDPAEIPYLLLAQIPYSEDLELVKSSLTNGNYTFVITSANAEYTIYADNQERIKRIESRNQFFDPIILDSVVYEKTDDGYTPSKVKIVDENRKIGFNFLIKKISFKNIVTQENYEDVLKSYTRIHKIEDIKINLN